MSITLPVGRRRREARDKDIASYGVGELLGPRPTAAPVEAPQPTSTPQRERYAPRLGWPEAYGGRAASSARPAVFRADTSQLPGLYPFLHSRSLPPMGAYIGWNTLSMQSFAAHPAAWVVEGIVTNPNVLVTGIPGAGKSANVKALSLRLMPFGVRTLIAGDVKGEYTALCRYLGVEPVLLGPGTARPAQPARRRTARPRPASRRRRTARTAGRDPPPPHDAGLRAA